MACWLGLMSGTSLDGVDAVLADDSFRDLAHLHLPFPAGLRAQLLALNTPGDNELHGAALAANGLSRLYAQAVQSLLHQAGVPASEVRALGAHGQTVRHQPGLHDGCGYTLQLINGALLAELCGIDVVCDFRSRDVAAGGQGAPLVPAFHAARFGQPGQDVAVLNLGGMANLSLLPANGAASGFDCGPGNVLLDLWCQQQRGRAFDAAGAWAASGHVHQPLLAAALAEPFFALPPPKSTGRELFDAAWLARWLVSTPTPAGPGAAAISAQDVAATLAELTAISAAQPLRALLPGVQRLLVCGGGAYNLHLLSRLQALLGPGVAVESTAAVGLAPERVEALAFAWLACAHMKREPGNLPVVTGARGPRVLGALYPAG
jgi:anhydro-N-acetylmuramic acid kinase